MTRLVPFERTARFCHSYPRSPSGLTFNYRDGMIGRRAPTRPSALVFHPPFCRDAFAIWRRATCTLTANHYEQNVCVPKKLFFASPSPPNGHFNVISLDKLIHSREELTTFSNVWLRVVYLDIVKRYRVRMTSSTWVDNWYGSYWRENRSGER